MFACRYRPGEALGGYRMPRRDVVGDYDSTYRRSIPDSNFVALQNPAIAFDALPLRVFMNSVKLLRISCGFLCLRS